MVINSNNDCSKKNCPKLFFKSVSWASNFTILYLEELSIWRGLNDISSKQSLCNAVEMFNDEWIINASKTKSAPLMDCIFLITTRRISAKKKVNI